MLVQDTSKLKEDILRLKKEKDVVILAHNYQIPDIQDIADFTGDSLGLSRQAAKVPQKTILFCGVHFMAETAKIISPQKKVLIPDIEAGCSLSDSITLDELKNWKKQHPKAIAVGYVNTTAEIKSELDYCCTSSNAVNVVNAIPKDKEILFLPDMFLGSYVAKVTGRKNMHIWAGECHVHAGITPDDVTKKLDSLKDSEFVIHPECSCTTPMLYDLASGSFDDRAKKITQALVKILNKCNVDFAVLGAEESCTGDPAKRAGNEFTFQMQAMMNIQVLNGYEVKKIVTACPHCFNTLKNEYPELGGNYEVIHHTQL